MSHQMSGKKKDLGGEMSAKLHRILYLGRVLKGKNLELSSSSKIAKIEAGKNKTISRETQGKGKEKKKKRGWRLGLFSLI